MNLAHAPRSFDRPAGDFARDFIEGLSRHPKRLPCKYFYDAAGAALFERICALPEYYQTRTELGILAAHGREMAALIGPDATLIEFGAGHPHKARILLRALQHPRAYVPIDICPPPAAVFRLAEEFAGLSVQPVLADFTVPFALPFASGQGARRIGFFPGSTIGNFTREEALSFLRGARQLLRGGGLLIGVDLVKDPALLHAAYNDGAGVTAAFNRNMLVRANHELAANFDLATFHHYAPYNVKAQRIEMYLVSHSRQRARAAGHEFFFMEGEAIHTEDAQKYTCGGFRALATEAGFVPKAAWSDQAGLFSVHWLDAGG